MKTKQKKLFLKLTTLFLLLFSFTLAYSVLAAEPTAPATSIEIPSLKIKIPGLTLSGVQECGDNLICVPWLSQYSVGLYNYAIGLVGVLASVTIMYGGFLRVLAAGDPSKIKEANAWLSSAVLGVIIALTSYTIMSQVNPNLVGFKYLKITKIKDKAIVPFDMQFEPGPTGSGNCNKVSEDQKCSENYAEVDKPEEHCADFALGYICCCQKKSGNLEKPVIGAGKCQATASGNCSVEKMKDSCFADMAEQASAICSGESGSNASIPSGVDYCCGDKYDPTKQVTNSKGVVIKTGCDPQYRRPVSFGLFQVNIASGNKIGGKPCLQAFSKPYTGGSSRDCKVVREDLYASCVNAAKDPTINIDTACQIQKQGSWTKWGYFTRAEGCGGSFKTSLNHFLLASLQYSPNPLFE